MLYTGGRDEATAIPEVVMALASLQLSNMLWVNVTKKVLTNLDPVDSGPDIDALVSSCARATNITGCARSSSLLRPTSAS